MVLTRLIQLVGNKVGPDDGVTADGADLSKQAESLLDGFLGAVSRQQDRFTWQICPVDYPAGRAILDADRSLQPVVVCLGLERLACLFD
ncbi:MAG TPA: hypothetical protein VKB09_12175, partial [Thermomicrobiales bacterium]|nr:hypothetical protein [Thermomicrobiales bacterium]